ncbi:PilZ domain-containing protein [Motiliproteus sp.]|uniref:PilZ domain-containing protein n=1 Tax=Motiliproteus sp. TaxID=1898955 RepID=UPI003BAB2D26
MKRFLKLMFWKRKSADEQLYVRCEIDNKRSNYRVTPEDNGTLSLLIEGEPARIKNISVSGIAFELNDSNSSLNEKRELHGILYIGHRHSPIPLLLQVLDRQASLLRCRILNLDSLTQRKLSAAITHYQKQQIRSLSRGDDAEPVQQNSTPPTFD